MNEKSPFLSKIIRWRELWPLISGIIAGFGAMALGDVASIAAILLGEQQIYLTLKALFILGVLTGIGVTWLFFVRPRKKLLNAYRDLTNDMLGIIRFMQAKAEELDDHNRRKRIEGDEWRDADP